MLTCWTGTAIDLRQRVIQSVINRIVPKPKVQYWDITEYLYVPEAGETVLVMGNKALDLLKAEGLVQKNRTINWMRGKIVDAPPSEKGKAAGKYLATFDPFMVTVDAAKSEQIAWDIMLAARLDRTGSLDPELGDYGYTDTLKDVIQYVEERYEETGKPVEVSTDLETMGLFPWYPDKDIVSVSMTVAEGYSDVVYVPDLQGHTLGRVITEIQWLLNSSKVKLIGANLKFDLLWMRVKWGITCTNFKADTLLMGSLIDENRSNSLNTHAKVYTPLGGYDDNFNATHDKAHMELVPKEDLLLYAGGDTDACLRAYNQIKRALVGDGRLTKFYTRLLQPAARAFENVEYRGILIDEDKYRELGDDVSQEIAAIEEEAFALITPAVLEKYKDDLKLSRAAILKDFLFTPMGLGLKPKMVTPKTGQPSTAYEHLMMFSDHPKAGPFLKLLKEWTSCQKTLGTYVDGFLNHLRPDGKFHPTYALYAGSMFEGRDDDAGTVTGRTSAKNPAIQTLPKHTKWAKRLRECYIALPGYKFFQVDYSQGELRVAACVAGETMMLDAYRNGVDLHALTGSKLAGYEYQEFIDLGEDHPDFIKFRQRAKPSNFGLLYGMGHVGYREYARTAYGVNMTEEEAFEAREAFFALYPELIPWHNASIGFAKNHQHIRSPLGRVRHLPLINTSDSAVRSHAERQAINSPIQSCLSDMCLWSIGLLDKEYGKFDELQLIGMTHDSVYGYVDETCAEQWVGRVANVMENLPFEELGWNPQLSFPVDTELGSNLANLKKVQL